MKKFAIIKDGAFQIRETESVMDLKPELGIDLFECVEVQIGGERFDIWCDEEGLFYDDRIVSAKSMNAKQAICGNIAIAKCNHNGETLGLTDSQIKMLQNYLIVPRFDSLVQYSGFGCTILKGRKLLCYNN